MRAMRRLATVSLLALLMWAPAAARAQDPLAVPGEDDEDEAGGAVAGGASAGVAGEARGLGLGASSMLGLLAANNASIGVFGPAVYYDAGRYHLEGMLGFASAESFTDVALGARFWYHMHQSPSADFSLGGGLGFISLDFDGGGDATVIDLEGGAQVRFFLVDNVALSASLGLALLTSDLDAVLVTGNLFGSTGIAYYF
jgi:hypothetical protein